MKKPEQDISKLLNELKTKTGGMDGFKVPQGYFEELPERIIEGIPGNRSSSFQKNFYQRRFLSSKVLVPLLAAASILIFVFFYYSRPAPTEQSGVYTSDTLNLTDAYDASYAAEVVTDEFQLTDELMESLSAEESISFIDTDDTTDAIPDEIIIEYLNSQEIDPSLLAEL